MVLFEHDKARRDAGNAIKYADKLLSDVDKDYPGYDDLWMVHHYDYFRVQLGNDNLGLHETIESFSTKALTSALAKQGVEVVK